MADPVPAAASLVPSLLPAGALITAAVGLVAGEVATSGDGRVGLLVDGAGACTGLRVGDKVLAWKPGLPPLVEGRAVATQAGIETTHAITGDALGLVWRQTKVNRTSAAVAIGCHFQADGGDKPWTAPGLPLEIRCFPEPDAGVSLIVHPEDALWSNGNRRLEPGAAITFTALIRIHAADWRPGVAALCQAFPAWMDPTNPRIHRIVGGGAYSSSWEVPDGEKAMRLGYRCNWKASFDFPAMGVFVAPTPVSATTAWKSICGQETSIARMAAYSTRMRQAGLYVFDYFNLTEAGYRITEPAPPRRAASDADLWRDGNDWVHYGIRDAVMNKDDQGHILYTNWEKCVIVDPGEPRYRAHLVDQARRLTRDLPDSAGITIDRMDHLHRTNARRSDGLSLRGSSLAVSWTQVMDDIGPIFHQADKVIMGNPIGYYQLAAYRHLDGIWTEYWKELEACSLLCVNKPLIVWSGPYDDAAMQKALHHGAWPTCPMPGNDHCQGPDPAKEAIVADYGPLFDALRGRRWALHARPIACDTVPTAKLNLFHIPGGYLATVTAAGTATTATVRLPALPLPAAVASLKAWSITPAGEWNAVAVTRNGDDWTATIPLARGCGLVRLHWAWIEPFQPWWKIRPSIEVQTTVAGATIRATTDGRPPQADTPPWTTPLTPGGSLTLRAGIWKDGQRLGEELFTDFIEVP